ncbi:hypothetical protein FACS1894182_03630 [Bacteroidia bacterium]|nr:hypothetical protein FACS1894182_03630 [Bacteroidia bacterium]
MNKEKTKRLMQKSGRYLRDFSIVVAGIAVTLYVNSWLADRNEKKDTVRYLTALKLELEQDTIAICNIIKTFEKSSGYERYILSHDKQSLNRDSIESYRSIQYHVLSYTPQTSAFEMFKISGNMRFINNKETMQSIWNAYSCMEDLKNFLDSFYQCKDREIDKDVQFELEKGKPVDIPMYGFFWRGRDTNMLEICRERLQVVKETLSKLDEIITDFSAGNR